MDVKGQHESPSLTAAASDAGAALRKQAGAPSEEAAPTGRRRLLLPAMALIAFVLVLVVEWPALSGERDRDRMTEAAVAGLSVAGHLVEDYAGESGRLPESLDSLGLVGSGLLYTHTDSSYAIALVTVDGDTVTHRGIVHLKSGGRP